MLDNESMETNEVLIGEDIFPMVVFLRGDESYFNDFSMNADEVMALLGIRRSRLNQISGRELRVGRTRIKNYVRPVYRKEDVEEYLAWIRPTATHKKSSELLNEARSKLEAQSDKLSNDLSSRFENWIETFTSDFQTQFRDQKTLSKSMLFTMQKTLRVSLRALLQKSSFTQNQSLTRWDLLQEKFDEIQSIRRELEELKAASVQISDATRYMERVLLDAQDSQKAMNQKLDTVLDTLSELKNMQKKDSFELPLVRLRKGEGVYSRGRKDVKNDENFQETCEKTSDVIAPWRRRRAFIKDRSL